MTMRRRTDATKPPPAEDRHDAENQQTEYAEPPPRKTSEQQVTGYAEPHTVVTGRENAGGTPQAVGDSDALGAGDTLTVTIGSETFCPVKYHPYVVGPLSVSVRVREGESGFDAYQRAREFLTKLVQVEFEVRTKEMFGRIRQAAASAGVEVPR
jgi:hypothetical protein